MISHPFALIASARRTALRWFVIPVLLCTAGARAAESVTAAWVQHYSHPTTASGVASKVVTDHAGSVIVVGSADNGVSGEDFLIIKYSAAGVPIWTNRYDGSGGLNDQANGVAVDANDNVFVTGICCAEHGIDNGDFATIKYSGAGVPLWTNYYNGPGDGDDVAWAIAVDSGGNVLVTGHSSGADTSKDYATVAYSSAGVPLWTNRYNGPAHSFDQAIALAVDSGGNVFVCNRVFARHQWLRRLRHRGVFQRGRAIVDPPLQRRGQWT